MEKRFLNQGFRWYGPEDSVSLSYIKQAGAESVFTSLHHIPYGELWTEEEILKRKKILENAGLIWSAVESVPVSEKIKTRTDDFQRHIENYKKTLENLGRCGVDLVIYNFMPVLDWIRTDLNYVLPDGSTCLRFDPAQFAAFEIYMLKRAGAESDYDVETLSRAKAFYESLSEEKLVEFERTIIDVFPGCKMGLDMDDVRKMLDTYKNIDADKLHEHLKLFLQEVVPVAEKFDVRMAIHPDDPPFNVLGLPRIASRIEDFRKILSYCNSPSNSINFCTGSLSAGSHNDLPKMLEELKERIHVVHLRSTQREKDGSFIEAGHIEGSVPMYEIVKKLLEIQKERLEKGEQRILFRPDHGRLIADDLEKPQLANPGYSYIGRLKGLAELRGLQYGILNSPCE